MPEEGFRERRERAHLNRTRLDQLPGVEEELLRDFVPPHALGHAQVDVRRAELHVRHPGSQRANEGERAGERERAERTLSTWNQMSCSGMKYFKSSSSVSQDCQLTVKEDERGREGRRTLELRTRRKGVRPSPPQAVRDGGKRTLSLPA